MTPLLYSTMQELSYSQMPRINQQDASEWKALAMAGLVHVLLLAFLWIGVQWQSHVTVAEEVEVWDLSSREAAQAPIPVPEPIPEVKDIEEPPKAEPLPKEDPEIALEQERLKRLEEKRREELALAKKKLQEEKLAAEQLKKEKLAKDLADKKKLAKEKALQDKIFQENMNRLNNQVNKSGSGGLGDALKSSGMRGDPSYAGKVSQKIRANTTYVINDASSNNPTVEFSIQLFPDGSLKGPIKKIKSSGVPAFDEAVEKAIEKSQPFPRDKSGEVPSSLNIIHRMKD